jgi:hypothetical protein
MKKLSTITFLLSTCFSLGLTKPLPSLAFAPSDVDSSNDAFASLAVPLKMLRFNSQEIIEAPVSERLLDSGEASISPLSSALNLYAVSFLGSTLSRYDSSTGNLLKTDVIGTGPRSVTIGGANQDLFVSGITANNTGVYRYDREGNFLGTFATNQGGSALFNPGSLKFGPNNGNLFVSNAGDSSTPGFISQFNKDTGAFLGIFASNGISFKPSGITFGVDSNLYVSDSASKNILQFNGSTGALLGTFASNSSLLNPGDLAFGPNGNLFVGNTTGNLTGNILQFNGITGAFINVFNSGSNLGTPTGIAFDPDNNLYVTDALNNKIVEFDGTTGAFVKNFTSNSSSNDLLDPQGLVFGPAPVPEPEMGVGFPSLLLMGAYIKSKKYKSRN